MRSIQQSNMPTAGQKRLEEPLVSINVIHHSDWSRTVRMLDSLFDDDWNRQNCVVMLLDNCSTDIGTIPESYRKLVTIIKNSSPRGFGSNQNRLATSSLATKYLMWLNSDLTIPVGGIRSLVGILDSHDDIGSIGPRLVGNEGKPQLSFHTPPSFLKEAWRMLGFSHLPVGLKRTLLRGLGNWSDEVGAAIEQWSQSATCNLREVDALTGAAVLLRRSVWQAVGGFDEGFFMYYEDTDWFNRMRERGFHAWYISDIMFVHEERGSWNTSLFIEYEKSCLRYHSKYGSRLRTTSLRLLLLLRSFGLMFSRPRIAYQLIQVAIGRLVFT